MNNISNIDNVDSVIKPYNNVVNNLLRTIKILESDSIVTDVRVNDYRYQLARNNKPKYKIVATVTTEREVLTIIVGSVHYSIVKRAPLDSVKTKYYSVSDIADMLKLHKNTVYYAIDNNMLQHTKIGNKYVFTADNIKAWRQQLDNRGKKDIKCKI